MDTHVDPADPAITTRGLTRRFGRRVALAGVDLDVARGECLAIFGPNGAGKTTLLRVLAGLLDPTSGTARVGGVALPAGAAGRAQVGLVSHHTMLYPALTARENVEFAAQLHGVAGPREAALEALTTLEVPEVADLPVRVLSRGQQQRVSIARALVHEPRILLLDEPYTGLDAPGAAALSRSLSALQAAGATLLLVTHHLDEGLALGTRVAIMQGGRVVRSDAREAIDATAYAAEYRGLSQVSA